jgi:ATP-binding cassette subfamily F protein uup
MSLVILDRVSIAFGHVPLLEAAELLVDPGERVAVIGRNGAGKSTLLQVLSGELVPDRGSVWREPGQRVARLSQDATLASAGSVFDIVAEGLGDVSRLVTAYHHAATEVAAGGTSAQLTELGRLQHALDERDGWRLQQRVELVLARLDLQPEARVEALSGGWRRRVLLGRALVAEPDLLLLDEPTNHLDLEAIEWLETYLAAYAGAVVFVTHDRTFLQRLATRIVELDRARLTSWPGDYAAFVRKKEAWLENEAIAGAKFDKRLAQEETWLRRGVKARRTRDEGRVRALLAMRDARAARRAPAGVVRLQIDQAEPPGQAVFETQGVSKSYGATPVIRAFSTRVMRGDRIGLIGPNGSGKTTLLRLLVGEILPDEGEIRRGEHVQVAYFDQQREQLDPERTVADTVADGNDTVMIGGERRHVHGYLRDFLFPPERAQSPVKALSGGERNRLLVARLLARPANVLVLDEPTNDLDLETLELVEAAIVDFPGTVLLVSHDRAFLDNVVTSTMVFEGDGHIEEYVGGYEDWLRQRPPRPVAAAAPASVPARSVPPPLGAPAAKKLSYRERREFTDLPERIRALEEEAANLNAAVAHPDFYKESAASITRTLARIEDVRREVEEAYRRWDELDSRSG